MNKNMDIQITELVRGFGIKANLNGYVYIQDAIKMVANNGTRLRVSQEIYHEIARKNKTTFPRVERAIRHAIEAGWPLADENLKAMFRLKAHQTKPTNLEFLATLADTLNKGMYRQGGQNIA